MFEIAISIGIYGYSIFLLGLIGILYWPVIALLTLGFFAGNMYYFRQKLKVLQIDFHKIKHLLLFNRTFSLILFLILMQALVNLVGALGPELGFDALWYHLTFPKIYLSNHAILHIPGGLLYYSDMPKFVELLYTGLLSFHIDILPKLLHFGFGLGILIILYQFSRKWFSPGISLLVCSILYANLVVGWESITAYIDLGRTFFELLAMYAFILWSETKNRKWFYYSALMVGLSIASKIIAIPGLFIIVFLICLVGISRKTRYKTVSKQIIVYMLIALLIPLPWFVFSFIHTGNPVYPLFDSILGNAGSAGWQLINPLYFIQTFWTLFTHAADPVSPLYLIVLPLTVYFYKKSSHSLRYLYWYSGMALFFWYITPNTGGGRFILPYLPIFSILSIYSLMQLQKKYQKFFIALIIIVSITSIFYRGVANMKFLPVIFHKETTITFLTKNLNFSFGDFVDSDGYFKSHIKPTDKILLYGFHNLYYVDFPFIDNSYIVKGDTFNYIAVQNAQLPDRFKTWNLIYTNPVTHVSLYRAGGLSWTY